MKLSKNRRVVWVGRIIVLFSIVLLGACNDDNVIGPQFEPEITNTTDNFQLQVTDISNITQTLTYTWQNTGTIANVNQSCSITGGTAMLSIDDAAGNQVYSKDLNDNGTFITTTGTAGNWTIHVILSNCSGTLNFRVQKP